MRSTTIREARNLAGRFRSGLLSPCMAVALKGGEGGLLTQSATIELDPVFGRLITPVTAELHCVFVPVQAMVALRDDQDSYAGITEVIRQKYLDGAPIFNLENEHEVSMRMGVMPISSGGAKKVSVAARLAHNAAVNFLRQSLYTYAALVPASNVAQTPALLSSTVLSRFNAVLNPDDHINGMVSLDLSVDRAQVMGITAPNALNTNPPGTNVPARPAQMSAGGTTTPWVRVLNDNDTLGLQVNVAPGDASNVFADLSSVEAGGFSLTQLYNAELMDKLTRQMRAIIDANPVDGEDQVVRWAHGLQVDNAVNPFLLARRSVVFGQDLMKAMDGEGIEAEVTQSRLMVRLGMTVPVPTTELGGVVVTFLVVKPDEVLKQQPHPVLSQPWGFENLMAEELMNDPVAVIARDIDATVDAAGENTVVFYTGFNELRRTYINYGWNRYVDPATVDAKNAIWQYEIPTSVSPENIVYPPLLPQDPFLDQDAEIARYMISSTFVGKSPIYIGPSPVETVAVIDSEDLFQGGGN